MSQRSQAGEKKVPTGGGEDPILGTMGIARSEGVFRDPSQGLAARLAELRRLRQDEAEALDPAFGQVLAARIGRTIGGAVAVAGMLGVFALAMSSVVWHGVFAVPDAESELVGAAILAVWIASLGVAALGWALARHALARWLARDLAPSGDSHRDLDRLEHTRTLDLAASLLQRWEGPSLAWPLAGAAMTLPLFLHFAVFEVASGFSAMPLEFGYWVVLSAVLVTHCHVVVARRCYRYGRDLAASRTATADHAGVGAIGIAMAISLVPGLALLGVPTLLVGLTASVLVPAMFWDARRTLARERSLLDAAVRA